MALELLDIYVTLSQVPHEEVVMKGYGRSLLMASLFVLASFLGSGSSMAEDELFLCGIVKEVDGQNLLVDVNVLSESCPGPKTFKLLTPNQASLFKTDATQCFFIDSNRCNERKTYTILKIEGVRP